MFSFVCKLNQKSDVEVLQHRDYVKKEIKRFNECLEYFRYHYWTGKSDIMKKEATGTILLSF